MVKIVFYNTIQTNMFNPTIQQETNNNKYLSNTSNNLMGRCIMLYKVLTVETTKKS